MATEGQQRQGTKRAHDETEAEEDDTKPVPDDGSASDDDIGPALPSAEARKKKRRKLPYEKQYVAALPAADRYSKSLMHRDQLSFCTFTPHTDFLITSSVDGYVKFWKKVAGGIEFVKEYKAHDGEIKGVTVSVDGRSYATLGVDNTIKIFDVVNFDLLAVLQPETTPKAVCYVHGHGSSYPMLAVSSETNGDIAIYDGRGENQQPIHTIAALHRKPVHLMAYNDAYDCVISVDESGMIEYWRPSGSYEKPDNVFDMKSGTSLFEFKKAKSVPSSLTISPTCRQFATFSFPDRKVRVFDFASGKLHRTYDESITIITEMQQAGTLSSEPLEAVDFGRRIAVERELDTTAVRSRQNVIFDESGHFILYGSLVGTKVINTLTNRVVKLYGREEPFRPLNLALFQGQPDKKDLVTIQMAASDNPLLAEAEARDAMLVATGSTKSRFYMFTNTTQISKSDRDIHNEKPKTLNLHHKTQAETDSRNSRMATTATLHTTLGDIHLRLYPQHAPKAVENFTVHAREGYYNNLIFHRVIRKFMIQTGDPLGDGTGGESIWGREFEDEFTPELRHDRPYVLSMANAGPGTNASQFFVTTGEAAWLDGKHTIFGRCVRGMEVVHAIENVRVWKEKPVEDVKIVDVSVD
ncbi:Peptidyl-prolyl cis-trans isomerase cyp15 [Friedmanniomyces endolithicus]|nr:Peptidyl-prolyl cis-trans isomerase cyp15 [Friedmanniomyces endolithicus]KAK0772742.1 Peptidyl-prolyl cis-trans isomerase cyp15 [Friedmanniomyces endolithicus]KAK0792472.1 Peptidyl-prolyl cis-trans isomerase cyp15 [Friedmanniomyces endolithicus]KAK0795810.1 Peptidyl-prolyl cis-trans isomerase cyp15 [Friedmanniomyces endolithicus]KAK0830624.1 Peptidyl-prolyl cis-trans isomerase cyp15 [Friedmanniomyces endolithicus]